MNKIKLGYDLSQFRGSQKLQTISPYIVRAIEKGDRSYGVSNLIKYCNEIGVSMYMTDVATQEEFSINTIQDVHKTLQLLMQRYQWDDKKLYRKSGVHYTPQVDDRGSLSADTFMAMCDTIHIKFNIRKPN